MKKTLISLLLVLVLTVSLAVFATAEETAVIQAADLTGFNTALETAVGNPNKYIQLTGYIDGEVTVTGNLYLDLNGYGIKKVTIDGGELYVFDSVTNNYDIALGDNYGMIGEYAEVNGGKLVRDFVTRKALFGRQLRYATLISGNGVVSSHRFYIGVSHTILMPNQDAIDYRTIYLMNEVMAQEVVGYGGAVAAWDVSNDTQVGETVYAAIDKVTTPIVAYANSQDDSVRQNWRRIEVGNILGDNPDYNATKLASTCRAYIVLADGHDIFSSEVSKTFQQAVVAAQSQAEAGTLGEKQNAALTSLYVRHQSMFEGWTNAGGSAVGTLPVHCVCGASFKGGDHTYGCDKVSYVWKPAEITLTSGGSYNINTAGNYYLTGDITSSEWKVMQLNNGGANDTLIRLDLNGHNITGGNGRALQVWNKAIIWLTNTSASGGVVSAKNSTTTDPAGVIHLHSPKEFNVIGNITLRANEGAKASEAGIMNVIGNVNIYSGVIDGSKATVSNNGGAFTVPSGTNLCIYGGTVYGGNVSAAGSGSAIYASGGNVTIKNATIYGGTVKNNDGMGGTVYMSKANLTLEDATIYASDKSKRGGAVYLNGAVTASMDGGYLYGKPYGKNYSVQPTAASALYVDSGADFTFHSGTISGEGVATTFATTLVVESRGTSDPSTFVMNGGTIIGGTANGYSEIGGGAVRLVHASTQFTMNGGTIRDGKANNGNGGNVHVAGGTFTMNGGTISGGYAGKTAAFHGGGVFVASGATFIMNNDPAEGQSAPSITGNTASNCAGGVYVANGATLKVNGGSITGNAANAGTTADIYAVNGKIVATGGTLGYVNAIHWRVDDQYTYSEPKVNDVVVPTITAKGGNVADVYVSGNPVIQHLELNASGKGKLDGTGAEISIRTPVIVLEADKTLGEGASITINETSGVVSASDSRFEALANKVHGIGGTNAYYDADAKVLAMGMYHCVCGLNENGEHYDGCDKVMHHWKPWPKTDRIPYIDGYWYLTGNVAANGAYIVGMKAVDPANGNYDVLKNGSSSVWHDTESQNVVIDLNGYGIYRTNGDRAIRMDSPGNNYNTTKVNHSLTICDTKGGGALYSGSKTLVDSLASDPNAENVKNSQGTLIWVWGGGELNMYGITLHAANLSNNTTAGGALLHITGATTRLAGVTVVGSNKTYANGMINTNAPLILEDFTISGGNLNVSGTTTMQGKVNIEKLILPANTNSSKINIVGTLDAGSSVALTNVVGVFSGATVEANAPFFKLHGTETTSSFLGDSHMLALGGEIHCMCGASKNSGEHANGCDKKLYMWTPITMTAGKQFNESGNYYLTADATITDGGTIGFGWGNKNHNVVRLDLNGHSINQTNGNRMMQVVANTEVWLCNSKPTEGGVLSAYGENNQHSAVVQMYTNNATGESNKPILNMLPGVTMTQVNLEGRTITSSGVITVSGEFNMYGGTINGGKVRDHGGAIKVGSGAVLNILGGTVNGGTVTNGQGSAIYSEGASVTIKNATVGGGQVRYNNGGAVMITAGQVTLENAIINAAKEAQRGGGLYLKGRTVEATMTGGQINAVANTGSGATAGAALYVDEGAQFTMNSGTITATGISTTFGAAVLVEARSNEYVTNFTMKGGTINGGIANGYNGIGGGGVLLVSNGYTNKVEFDMQGGLITGGTAKNGAGGGIFGRNDVVVKISGTARVEGNTGGNLCLADGATLQVGTMAPGANVGITMVDVNDPITKTASAANEAAAQYFFVDGAGSKVGFCSIEGNALYQHLTMNQYHCVCGLDDNGNHFGDCDEAIHEWKHWDAVAEKKLPGDAGYWYLTSSGNVDNTTYINDYHVYIDLNGQTINVPGGWRIFCFAPNGATADSAAAKINGSLTITDTKGTGTLKKEGTIADNNLFIWNWLTKATNPTLNIYGGILDASNLSMPNHNGLISLGDADGTINMFGGQIKGSKIAQRNGGIILGNRNKLNMSGEAEITGANSNGQGANVWAQAGSVITMSGNSRIINGNAGTAQGGNLNLDGAATLNISGNAYITGGNNGTYDIFNVNGTINASGNAHLGVVNLTASGAGKTAYIKVADAVKIDSLSMGIFSGGTQPKLEITGTLDDAALIKITGQIGDFTTATVAENADNFQDLDGSVVEFNEETSCLRAGTMVHCLCGAARSQTMLTSAEHAPGCDEVLYIWKPATSASLAESGNYYLTSNRDWTVTFGSGWENQGKTVRFDLNGFNLQGGNRRMMQAWNDTTVFITNSKPTGGLVAGKGWANASGTGSEHSAVLQVVGTSKVTILGNVTLQQLERASDPLKVAGVCNPGSGSLTMYGGKVIAGNTYESGAAFSVGSNASLNLIGTEVVCGSSPIGGAIYNAGTVKLENVSFTGGTADHGKAIYNNGKLTLKGNITMSDTDLYNVGGKYFDIDGVLTGNVNLSMYAPGGRITNGNTDAANASVITVNGNAVQVEKKADSYLYIPVNVGTTMLVGYGEGSLNPTAQQLEFAQKGYLDASGQSPLPIMGFGTYAPGLVIGNAGTEAGVDDLRATAIAYTDSEGDTIIMISVDSTSVSTSASQNIRNKIAAELGIPADNILISCTHAHSTPNLVNNKQFYVGSYTSADGRVIDETDAYGKGTLVYVQATDEEGNPVYETNEDGEFVLDDNQQKIPVMVLQEAGTLDETYYETFTKGVVEAAKAAIDDRAKVTTLSTATVADANASNKANGKTNVFNEVRNYEVYEKGKFTGRENLIGMETPNHSSYKNPGFLYEKVYKPESAVDASLQLVKYVRETGNDIIISNFQTHPHRNSSGRDTDLTADVVGAYRYYLAKATGAKVLYFSGAGGNVNPHSNYSINSSYTKEQYTVWGNDLAYLALTATYTTKTGYNTDVQATSMNHTFTKMQETGFGNKSLEDRVALAEQIVANGVVGSLESTFSNADTDYGIYSSYHAKKITERYNDVNKNGNYTGTLKIFAYQAGPIAFAGAPYEMFDTNGVEIKTTVTNGGNYAMTFVATMANGSQGYIPSALGYQNGGYSTDMTPYAAGTGEALRDSFVTMINSMAN